MLEILYIYLNAMINYILSFFVNRPKLRWNDVLSETEYTYSKEEYDRTKYKESPCSYVGYTGDHLHWI